MSDNDRRAADPGRILLVNDNPVQLDATRLLLEQAGMLVETAATAREALARLRQAVPDVLISDVVLPGMDGIALCRMVKSQAATADLPVLLMSGLRYDDASVLEGLEAGAVDYLEIPTPVPLLLNKVERLTEQVRAGRARRAAEESLRLLVSAVQQSGEGILITTAALDAPGPEIVYVNPEMTRIAGYAEAELLGRSPRLLQCAKTARAVLDEMRRHLAAGLAFEGELINCRKDGTEYVVNMTISPIRDPQGEITHFVAVERDITKQRLLEMQLRHAQKMEAIGRLAGGVAHDFNNLLTAILAYSQLVFSELTAGDPLRDDVEQIRLAGERAAELTSQLLAFSHKQVSQPQVVSPNRLIEDMEKMLNRLISEDVHLVTALAPGLGHVRADPGQLQQVILNLVVNARDAMPAGGRITIETADVEIKDEAAAAGISAGEYVTLAVSDTGQGMDAETQRRAFEPFFTTKAEGRGTGMGLAIVYGIVEQHGGHIVVESAVGRGTAFRIYLPLIVGEAAVADPVPPAVQRMPRGTETILLVEDEEAVRRVAIEVLKRCGFTVLGAANAGEALLTCERYTGGIDLMLTDVVMPQMSGPELAERLAPLRPAMKVIYMSGYLGDDILKLGTSITEHTFIEKPFTGEALARKVRAALDDE